LEAKGARLEAGLRAVDLPLHVQRVGSMMTVFFGAGPLATLADVARCDTQRFARRHRGMLERGVYLPPSQYEAFFVSLAHSDADLDAVLAAHREVCATFG
jgi:glutamate-1-semialdehyde 2,1-aminomutase